MNLDNKRTGRPPKARMRVMQAMLDNPDLIRLTDSECARKLNASRQSVNAAKKEIYKQWVINEFAAAMQEGTTVQWDVTEELDEEGNVVGSRRHFKVVANPNDHAGVQTNIHDPTYTVGTNT